MAGPLLGRPGEEHVGLLEPPMRDLGRVSHLNQSEEGLPEKLPEIEIHHGAALWVLAQMGFQGAASKSTFYEYIKSLRKLGTPFEKGKIGFGRRALANYSYFHLMELALTLTLRVYHMVPDSILTEVVRHRASLYRCYRRAYTNRRSGLGTPISLAARGKPPVQLRGAFLDLQIDFSGGTLTSFGPPKLISAFDAVTAFAERDVAARALLPINLSLIAERVVANAGKAPPIRTGPAVGSRSRLRRRAGS
jgi:hypothetical protein